MMTTTSQLLENIRSVLSYTHDVKMRRLLNLTISHIVYLSGKMETLKEECHYLNSMGNINDYAPFTTTILNDKDKQTPTKEVEK